MLTRLALCLALMLCAALVSPARAGERITVFAAASLKEAMDEIAREFQAATGHSVVVSLAGSSALARQIQAGAPADIFISASQAWMETLAQEGLIESATRFNLAGNRLVLIAHGDAPPVTLGPGSDLAGQLRQGSSGAGRLAIALTGAVPAGIYAREALTTLGLWDDVTPYLAETDNVRAALALVALGEAPFGIVYATDAAAEPRVSVIATFPAESHTAIVYPAAQIAGRDSPVVDAFLTWLKGCEARAILTRLGFAVEKQGG